MSVFGPSCNTVEVGAGWGAELLPAGCDSYAQGDSDASTDFPSPRPTGALHSPRSPESPLYVDMPRSAPDEPLFLKWGGTNGQLAPEFRLDKRTLQAPWPQKPQAPPPGVWDHAEPNHTAPLVSDGAAAVASCEASSCSGEEAAIDTSLNTTGMMRNLPAAYTRDMLVALLDARGFHGKYDFVYLPINFSSKTCFGYAFVNMVTPGDAQELRAAFEGFSSWEVPSTKVCSVDWSTAHHGLQAHIDRYRNSPVLHPDVADEAKPILLRDGVRIAFPPPTKRVRAPRMRAIVD